MSVVSMTHALDAVVLSKDRKDLALVRCTCGSVAGPAVGHHWSITENPDGTVMLRPSIDWPGHFHLVFDSAMVVKAI